MFEIGSNIGTDPIVKVQTTNGRGRTPEEIAENCLDRIMYVSDSAPAPIRDQANAFKDAIRPIIIFYMREAINSDRTTLYNKLRDAGHTEVAEILRRP